MISARYLVPVLLAWRAVPAAADTLTDLLPPNSKVVFGVRVRNLAVSSVARSFIAQAHAAAAGWLKAVPLDGIDVLRDIDEVLISSVGTGPNARVIMVITGRFDVARLAEGSTLYHEVPLLTGDGKTGSAVALLADGTAVIGDPVLVRAALDQRGKSRIDAALNDRITSLRQRYDAWGLGELPAGFVAAIPEAELLGSAELLRSIDRFQFGMQLASGLELDAEVHARSPKDAEKLTAACDMIAAVLKGLDTPGSAAKFDTEADGGTLKLTVSIPDEELKTAIQAALSPVPAPPASASAAAESPETGPNATSEAAPGQPATPQPTPSKQAQPKALDKSTDTVILTLPGKK